MKKEISNSRNLKSLHGFGMFDLVTVVAAVAVFLAISVPIISNKITSQKILNAASAAGQLADKISLENLASLETSNRGRQIASEKDNNFSILDPWGQAFHIHGIRNSYGQVIGVAVWSNGPNSQNETHDAVFEKSLSSHQTEFVFNGDDVGVTRVLR